MGREVLEYPTPGCHVGSRRGHLRGISVAHPAPVKLPLGAGTPLFFFPSVSTLRCRD